MLTKYNNSICSKGYEPKHGLSPADVTFFVRNDDKEPVNTPYHSVEQEVFNKNSSLPICQDRTDGIITVDEKIANEWMNWAEVTNDFDFS